MKRAFLLLAALFLLVACQMPRTPEEMIYRGKVSAWSATMHTSLITLSDLLANKPVPIEKAKADGTALGETCKDVRNTTPPKAYEEFHQHYSDGVNMVCEAVVSWRNGKFRDAIGLLSRAEQEMTIAKSLYPEE